MRRDEAAHAAAAALVAFDPDPDSAPITPAGTASASERQREAAHKAWSTIRETPAHLRAAARLVRYREDVSRQVGAVRAWQAARPEARTADVLTSLQALETAIDTSIARLQALGASYVPPVLATRARRAPDALEVGQAVLASPSALRALDGMVGAADRLVVQAPVAHGKVRVRTPRGEIVVLSVSQVRAL